MTANLLAGVALSLSAFCGTPPFPAAHRWQVMEQSGVYIKGMRLW